MKSATSSRYRRFGKRTVDAVVALAGLVVLAPLFAALAVLVGLSLGRPVLFRQRRPGLGGRPFTLRKFRTMAEPGGTGKGDPADAERMTRVGRFLRASSLDELPQLWNVLRGEMSLVGPRPLLMEYLELYTPEQARRHEVLPGITGWAQVHGRNAVTWEERFDLDVWYVDHLGPALDLKILRVTVARVLRREGISASGHATMPPFTGSIGGERPASRPR